VTSREESKALVGLSRLLARDLSQLSTEELVEAIQQAEVVKVAAPEWSGRLLAALHRSGKSWPQIERLTGMSRQTAWRRAEPYM
jgi:hypothetical protein